MVALEIVPMAICVHLNVMLAAFAYVIPCLLPGTDRRQNCSAELNGPAKVLVVVDDFIKHVDLPFQWPNIRIRVAMMQAYNCALAGIFLPCYQSLMKLTTWLETKNLSQLEFAQRIGVSDSQVCRWCRNETTPSLRAIKAIERETRRQVTSADFGA